ncbi:MAG: hypothetical protein ACKOA4_07055, partial [Haliscomenobacter sp.]
MVKSSCFDVGFRRSDVSSCSRFCAVQPGKTRAVIGTTALENLYKFKIFIYENIFNMFFVERLRERLLWKG